MNLGPNPEGVRNTAFKREMYLIGEGDQNMSYRRYLPEKSHNRGFKAEVK